jgi:hypothetical protein
MSRVVVTDVPAEFWVNGELSFDAFITKVDSSLEQVVSPDLQYTKYDDMVGSHKEEFDRVSDVSKEDLLNI